MLIVLDEGGGGKKAEVGYMDFGESHRKVSMQRLLCSHMTSGPVNYLVIPVKEIKSR